MSFVAVAYNVLRDFFLKKKEIAQATLRGLAAGATLRSCAFFCYKKNDKITISG